MSNTQEDVKQAYTEPLESRISLHRRGIKKDVRVSVSGQIRNGRVVGFNVVTEHPTHMIGMVNEVIVTMDDVRIVKAPPALVQVAIEKGWRVVGIDGRHTPDPDYWYARWEVIESDTDQDALAKWFECHKGWVRDDERQLVKVHANLPHDMYVMNWIDQNHRGVKA